MPVQNIRLSPSGPIVSQIARELVPPSPNDDSTRGFVTGAIWVTPVQAWILVDSTPGAAVWIATGSGMIPLTAISGEALNVGDLIAMDDAAGLSRAFKANASVGTSERSNAIGFSQATVGPGVAIGITIDGSVIPNAFDVAPVAADVGKRVYMSTTPGNVSLTAPSASGQAVMRVGVLLSTASLVVQFGEKVVLV